LQRHADDAERLGLGAFVQRQRYELCHIGPNRIGQCYPFFWRDELTQADDVAAVFLDATPRDAFLAVVPFRQVDPGACLKRHDVFRREH